MTPTLNLEELTLGSVSSSASNRSRPSFSTTASRARAASTRAWRA